MLIFVVLTFAHVERMLVCLHFIRHWLNLQNVVSMYNF